MKKNVKTEAVDAEKEVDNIGDMLTAFRERATQRFDELADTMCRFYYERAAIESAYQRLVGTPMPPRVQEKNLSAKRAGQLSALRYERDDAMVKAIGAVAGEFYRKEWTIRIGQPRKH